MKKIVSKIQSFLQDNAISRDAPLVIGVSGGPDSMALLALLFQATQAWQQPLIVAHVDHQLRADSRQEIKLIKKYAADKPNILVENYIWAKLDHPQNETEAVARIVRYDFFAEVAQKYHAKYIFTAHHNDDLLENILLKLIRSGDVREMDSLQPRRNFRQGIFLLRPLLGFSKAELLEYVQLSHLPYLLDATNETDFTQRNRLRHEVIPFLKKESPNLLQNAQRFVQTTNQLIMAANRLFTQQTWPKALGDHAIYRGLLSDLVSLPDNERVSFLSFVVKRRYHQVIAIPAEVATRLSSGKINSFTLDIGGNLVLTKFQNYYYLSPNQSKGRFITVAKPVSLGTVFKLPDSQYLIDQQTEHVGYQQIGFFYADPEANLYYQNYVSGMTVRLADGSTQKAKKKFAEAGIPQAIRPYLLVIKTDKQIKWIEGAYQDQQFDTHYERFNIFTCVNK